MTRPTMVRPPRLWSQRGTADARHATWTELFFDLVFVVIVAELAHRLDAHVTWSDVLAFAALFVPSWWSWIGTTFYANRFDTDDLVHRLLFGAQMLANVALAVNVHDGLGHTSVGFALSYVAIRAMLVLMYIGAWFAEPAARPLTRHYAAGFALAAAIWLASVFVPPPLRFVFWIVGFVVEFATPLTVRHLQALLPPDLTHLPERFGLFVIVVLGESILAVAEGVADQEWRLASGASAALGFAVAFSLWWVYFDNVSESVLKRIRIAGQIWLYTHLFLLMGLTAAGVGVEHLVGHDPGSPLAAGDRWLLCGAVALSLLAIGVIHLTTEPSMRAITGEIRAPYHFAGAAAALLLGAFGGSLLPLALIACLTAICVAQVVVDLVAGDEGRGNRISHEPGIEARA